jgi:small subunit ribosomal protein S20
MPVIKSARKKLRQDKKRTVHNKKAESLFKKLIKKAGKTPTEKNIKNAVIAVDKATKKNIIHKNKAARLKSSLSKLSTNPKSKSVVKAKKKTKNIRKVKK